MEKKDYPQTINVTTSTKQLFELDRFNYRDKEGKKLTQEEFIKFLLSIFKKNKKLISE
jgi:predicted nucleic acid-binding protein